ncbi:MAG: hypothetical protein GWP05_01690 [Anaerolineaceae bacterium]|nr:hypothetical protein [Anaerolineaceae bacterium]
MEIRRSVTQLREHLQRLLHSPSDELDRTGQFITYQIRLWWFCGRKLVKDRLLVTASALSYKTLISIIPLFVVFFLILNAVTPGRTMQTEVKDFLFDKLNLTKISTNGAALDAAESNADSADKTAAEGAQAVQDNQTVATWLSDKVDEIVSKVQNQSKNTRTPITIVSIVLMIFAGMSIFATVEGALNHIWEVRHGRSWFMRLRDFLTTIIILGLLLGLATFAGQQLRSVLPNEIAVRQSAEQVAPQKTVENPGAEQLPEGSTVKRSLSTSVAWLIGMSSRLVPMLIIWLVFFIVYKTLPNVRVQNRAALIAGLISGVLWEFGAKLGFELYLRYATGAARLYGNLALLPVFLLWVWISWVIVLFGAELAYVIQFMSALTRNQMERETRRRFVRADLVAVGIASLVGRRFSRGDQPPSRRELSNALGMSEADVDEVAEAMQQHGLLRLAGTDRLDGGYVPARPLEQITMADVAVAGESIQLASRAVGDHGAVLQWARKYMENVSQSTMSALRQETLASLVRRAETAAESEPGDSGQ